VARTDPDQSGPDEEGSGLGQTLAVGGLILLFLVALGGLIYLTLLN
jgi:hypothetical protein